MQLRLRGQTLNTPAHMDAEALSRTVAARRSAVGPPRNEETGASTSEAIRRHSLPALLVGAWWKRDTLRPVEGLYAPPAPNTRSQLPRSRSSTCSNRIQHLKSQKVAYLHNPT